MKELETFNSKIMPLRGQLMERARQLTGNDASAEDLVQEVMLKLWTMRDTLTTHPNIKALALTMMRNKHRDRWRQMKRERLYADDMAKAGLQTFTHSTEAQSDTELVGIIVSHLPEMQQHVFNMKEVEGYETNEIAQIIGCSEDAVRQHLSRARKRIKETFLNITKARL